MNRIPKYTAGMFKRKMPRFGASSMKMPRMPKPPKPKKFDEGGRVEEEVVAYDPRDPKVADLLKRMDVPYEDIVRLRNRAVVRGKTGPYRGSGKAFREPIIGYDQKSNEYYLIESEEHNPPSYKGKGERLGNAKIESKASGGKVKSSCCRGDGVAKKGKTRGKFV